MRAGFYTDLEFDELLKQTAAFCVTEQGKAIIQASTWQNKTTKVLEALNFTNEYLASFSNNNRIPNHGFDPVDSALKLLEIPNSSLEIEQILRLKSIAASINEHIKFFKKFEAYYPSLSKRLSDFVYDDSIAVFLNKYLNRFGEIKDDASVELFAVRQKLKSIKSKINQAFGQALQHYDGLGYLDEIRESSMHDRRVLAVIATYKKKVKGQVMSTSKGGSIIYIEPEQSARLQNDFFNLQQEEREEIRAILKAITSFLREYLSFFQLAIGYLSKTDAIAAKARFSEHIAACLPEISTAETYLKNAFHPLLLLSNSKKKLPTFPQDITLHDKQRIIVISGPNAGGKSITLKTLGLLQVMLQTGFLVPVHQHSKMRIFNKILTDIGDNQSIENQLSTYSYRLKNMRHFLKNADEESLFLIDEFGTGSDPELGGALAEVMLEALYEQKATGVITTHYTNLKMLADSLPHMINATMLFDPKNLTPEFKLQLGEAGSSFTFEVAQKMGIPYRLINKAKKKIERSKLRFDQSIAKLQKERLNLKKTSDLLKSSNEISQKNAEDVSAIKQRLEQKLQAFQQLYEQHQTQINLGKSLEKLLQEFEANKDKKALHRSFNQLIKTYSLKQKVPQRIPKSKGQNLEHEVKQRIKKSVKQRKNAEAAKPKPIIKAGDRVRIAGTRSIGEVEKIEKNNALVHFDLIHTFVELDKLEKV